MASNNTSNAPQPTPATAAAAEIFNSTVAPPSGPLSTVDLGQSNTTEAPMHTGIVNNFDQYFSKQFVQLAQFTWSTSQDPGSLVYSAPIHPRYSHQWMRHYTLMYNTYAGGFDYGMKIAGTGFHAGALLIARLPPNIKPSSIRKIEDAMAFPYAVMDPKTLEVYVYNIMDQRSEMFHWIDEFNEANPRTFGGYVAVFVFIPLNTSSTGATSINVSMLTRPSIDFMFSQPKPIAVGPTPASDPSALIEAALDFSGLTAVEFIQGSDRKFSIPKNNLATNYVHGVFKANGELYSPADDDHINYIWTLGNNDQYKMFLRNVTTTAIKKWTDSKYIGIKPDGSLQPSLEGDLYTQYLNEIPKSHHCEVRGPIQFLLFFKNGNNHTQPIYANAVTATAWSRLKLTFKQDDIKVLESLPLNRLIAGFENDTPFSEKWDEFQDRIWIVPSDATTSIVCEKTFKPPLTESILRPGRLWNGMQFSSIRTLFSSGVLTDFLHSNEAVFLELYDTKAQIPVGKFKLYFDGFITTANPTTDVDYTFKDGKYKFNFLKIGPASTPLYSSQKEAHEYAKNRFLAKAFENF